MSWEYGLIGLLIVLIGKIVFFGANEGSPSPKADRIANDMKEVLREEREEVSEAGTDLARDLAGTLADRVRNILRWRANRLGTGDDNTDDGEQ